MPFRCSICGDEPIETPVSSEDDKSLLLLTCGHIAHQGCLNCWIRRESGCAQCSKKILMTQTMPIFPEFTDPNEEQIPKRRDNNSSSPCVRSIPTIYCSDEDCTDLYDAHTCLVSDYNELVEKYKAELAKAGPDIQECEDLEKELANIKLVDKYQKELISKLMKRPRCDCTDEDDMKSDAVSEGQGDKSGGKDKEWKTGTEIENLNWLCWRPKSDEGSSGDS